MDGMENWLRDVIRRNDNDEINWFLNRPSLKAARLQQMEMS
jgi:hypothetical protein